MTDDKPDRDARPSPDALLGEAAQEGRGRLKVFLGAAPGVGKTYEMLSQARQRKLDGVDVVIGVVETHGRVETDLLTKSFENIPKKRIALQGPCAGGDGPRRHPRSASRSWRWWTSWRTPMSTGSRHPKRYMDVEELLAAGIDVYTTLNVQHLESLNDVVAKITHMRVRETVPDSIFDRADDVELVDLTPDDLIQRLRKARSMSREHGGARRPELFHAGQSHGLARTGAAPHRAAGRRRRWSTTCAPTPSRARGRRASACWSASTSGPEPRRWSAMRGGWPIGCMLPGRRSMSKPRAPMRLSEAERDRIAERLRAGRTPGRRGGHACRRQDVADGVIDYAHANNFTHIVVVQLARLALASELFRRSVAHDIIRRAGDISVHVVPSS